MSVHARWFTVSAFFALLAILFLVPIPVHSDIPSIAVSWTWTGDDDNSGTATTAEGRWSVTKPDTLTITAFAAWWSAATPFGLPTPKLAGTPDSVNVTPAGGFQTGRTYYFVIRACDEVPNCGPYSNVAAIIVPDTMPPRRIIDLRARIG
jgi:hypothetical protein